VTLDIGANDELHAIAKAEKLAREAAEKAGNEAGYKYAVEAQTPGTEAQKAAEKAGNEAGYAYVVEAETPGTEAQKAAEKAGNEAAYAYVVEAETPGTPAQEAASIAGNEAFVAAFEKGASFEEAEAAGAAAGKAYVEAHAYAAGAAAGKAYVEAHAYAVGVAAGKAYVEAHAYAIGKAAAEKYGAEHGLAEVKAWLEGHALELFTHIVTNNAKIIGTLRANGYAGKVIVVGGYDPYGNVSGAGEVLAGSTALTKTLNQLEEAQLSKAPYSACFANPYKTFNTEKATEPARLQAYTNMANANVSNGKADGPDIHPTPLGYEVMAKIIRKDCGE